MKDAVNKPKWVKECENVIGDGRFKNTVNPTKHTLFSVMQILEKYGFCDSDWLYESDYYFEDLVG